MPGDVKVLENPESSEPMCKCLNNLNHIYRYMNDALIQILLVRVEVLAGESSSLFSFDLVSVLLLFPKNEEYGEAGTWVAVVGE